MGPKVADCVLLYGLGFWDAWPEDVWIKKAMATLFPKGRPRAAAGYGGVAQQYIFEYAPHPPAQRHDPRPEAPKGPRKKFKRESKTRLLIF